MCQVLPEKAGLGFFDVRHKNGGQDQGRTYGRDKTPARAKAHMKTDLKKPGIGSIGDRPWVFVFLVGII